MTLSATIQERLGEVAGDGNRLAEERATWANVYKHEVMPIQAGQMQFMISTIDSLIAEITRRDKIWSTVVEKLEKQRDQEHWMPTNQDRESFKKAIIQKNNAEVLELIEKVEK